MMEMGLQFMRSRTRENWFYRVGKARKAYLHDHQLYCNDQPQRAQSDVTESQSTHHFVVKEKLVDRIEPEETRTTSDRTTEPAPNVSKSSNLELFLESITPLVTFQYLSKTTMRGWRICNVEFQPYYVLGDVWEGYKEWSAYGAGVSLILNDTSSVFQ